jgi:L-ascorbate oxidase
VFSRQAMRDVVLRRAIGVAGAVVVMWAGAQTATAQTLAEPPVFSSHNGVLDIMMVAIAKPIPTISFTPPHSTSVIHPTGWVYQICPRPTSGLSCPSGSSTVSPYGGTRLALQQGDVLKIRFRQPLAESQSRQAQPRDRAG